MSARKRRSRPQEEPVVVEVEPEPDPAIARPPRAKRRKPANPMRCPPSLAEQARGLNVKRLYDAVRTLKEEQTNRLLCSAFLRLPNRKSCPQYYECIAAPVDLTRIQHRLKFSEYPDLAALVADLELLINNARLFYPMSSQEAKDATSLEVFLRSQLEDLCAIDSSSVKFKSPGGTPISPKSPGGVPSSLNLDLLSPPGGGTRRSRGGSGRAQLTEEVTPKENVTLPKGQAASAPGSSSKRVRGKKLAAVEVEGDTDSGDLEETAPSQGKGSTRRRQRDLQKDSSVGGDPEPTPSPVERARSRKRHSDRGVVVPLGGESETEVSVPLSAKVKKNKTEASEKEDTSLTVKIPLTKQLKSVREKGQATTLKEEAKKKPRGVPSIGEFLLSIYDAVISKQDADGRVLSDIFMVRPSRKLYPEYYLVISQPTDLKEIRAKISSAKYSNVAAFLEDMNTLFTNAQLFNEETSLVHHDSVTLSCLTSHTLKELWKEKAPPTGEELDELLAIMTSARRPTPFNIPGHSGQFVLSIKAHVFLGLPRGDLFKWFPDLKVSTTAEERKAIVKQGVCSGSAMALRVIPLEDVEPFFSLKDEGLTGRQLLKLQVPSCAPRSTKQARSSEEEEEEEEEGEGTVEVGSGGGLEGEVNDEESLSEDAKMCKELLKAVKQAKTTSGRLISSTFQQIPAPWTKAEHSYSVGKKMIDLRTITEKHSRGHYSSFIELLDDFHLMCNVACRLSAPNSQHYNDAVLLHSFVLRKKHELLKGANWRGRKVNARERVQSILRRIIRQTVKTKGSMSNTPGGRVLKITVPASANSEQEEEILDLDTIVTNVNQGKYHQLGRMQDDLMGLLDYLRCSNQPGSMTHLDAIELTRSYIKYRDKLTGEGTRFFSPALSKLTQSGFEMELQGELALVGPSRGVAPSDGSSQDGAGGGQEKEQLSEEGAHGEDAKPEEDTELDSAKGLLPDDGSDPEKRIHVTEAEHNGCMYHVGDHVCVESRYPGKPHHIVAIEKLWRVQDTGEYWFSGVWFFRPEETFHVATRRFYEKELFKTEFSHMLKLSQVVRRCHVMFIKDYTKFYPEGIADDDVYVCESRYIYKVKVFKKYKTWSPPAGRQPKLIKRSEPIVVKRVPSVFAVEKEEAKAEESQSCSSQLMGEEGTAGLGKLSDSDTARDSSSEDEGKVANGEDGRDEEYIDYDWENVEMKDAAPEPQCTYYEQFVIDGNRFRLGDYVFVRSEEARPYIARIDRMWTDGNRDPWFHGPWFVHPDEVEHLPTRMFYHNEVFQSNIQDTNPMRSVIGRCAVLTLRDYCRWRPTEVFEDDVFICENKYNERDKEIRRLKGLKTFAHSSAVLPDEVYYFDEEIPVTKVPSHNLHDILRLSQAPVVQPAPPLPPKLNVRQTTPTVFSPAPAHPLKAPPPAKLTAQPLQDKGVESFPDEKYMETMLGESSIVASAMVFMAEDIQKQLSGQGLTLPLDVINNVVANEWASMTDEQRLPYQRKAVIFRVAHTAAVSGIKMPAVSVSTSTSVSSQIASVLQQNIGSQASNGGGAKPLSLLPPRANLSVPTLTQTTASSSAQSSSTVTKSSGGGVKVGGVTLSPGMTLTQKHIQHLQQIMLHAQQLAASHKNQAGASKPQPVPTSTTATTTTSSSSAPRSSKETPQFLDDDASKVIHTILYLKYLDDLKRGVRQMSSWEAAIASKDLAPNTEAVTRISSWIDPQMATDSPSVGTQAASTAQEQASDDTRSLPPVTPAPRTEQAAIIEALKKLHDHMMQQSVDIANLVKKIE